MKTKNTHQPAPADGATPNRRNADQLAELEKQLAEAEQRAILAQESERRALADYQNLVRRQQQERSQLMKLAAKDVVEQLLEPLDHLAMAAQQLNDQGLRMVIDQLWNVLRDQGLTELEVLGKPFDIETMEVVDTQGSAQVVIKIVSKGYTLYGQVIRHAKVIMGDTPTS